jgi:L-iditol 2-dehydrogenase
MRSLLFTPPSTARLVETPVPTPREGEALVRVEVSAICGSELHAQPGTNPGHEAAGIIEYVPPGSALRTGQRVGVSAVTGCGRCPECLRGVALYCKNGFHIQTAMHADYVAAPFAALRPIPDGMSATDAVLVSGDALGVPTRTINRVPSRPGDRVLVNGLGPIGLGHTLVRARAGAYVVAIEPSLYRRRLATQLGAAEVLEPGEAIGYAPHLVIECTGLPSCIDFALGAVECGGTVVQSGECSELTMSPSATLIRREVTYTGSWYYAEEDFPSMVRSYQDGLPIAQLVTHEFPADQVADAYALFASKQSGKVVVVWSTGHSPT